MLNVSNFRRSQRSAFSLIELMVVVSLLSVIILGLMAMFSQTQRAFKLGMNQTDILESGRIATDLIARDIEGTAPANSPWINQAPNFFVQPMKSFDLQMPPSASTVRMNTWDDLFFMARENKRWVGIGYFVRFDVKPTAADLFGPLPPNSPVAGSLYRIEMESSLRNFSTNQGAMRREFEEARMGRATAVRSSKILDGVVHFRIRPFDPSGITITNRFLANIQVSQVATGLKYEFHSNAVPGFVELELGVLESDILERYQGLPVAARADYLRRQAAHVHLFRQRIPLRNVDFSAYP